MFPQIYPMIGFEWTAKQFFWCGLHLCRPGFILLVHMMCNSFWPGRGIAHRLPLVCNSLQEHCTPMHTNHRCGSTADPFLPWQVPLLRIPEPVGVRLLRRLLHHHHPQHAGAPRTLCRRRCCGCNRPRLNDSSLMPCSTTLLDVLTSSVQIGVDCLRRHSMLLPPQIAYMISGMIYFMWSLHCGFIIPSPSYPGWWIWL